MNILDKFNARRSSGGVGDHGHALATRNLSADGTGEIVDGLWRVWKDGSTEAKTFARTGWIEDV